MVAVAAMIPPAYSGAASLVELTGLAGPLVLGVISLLMLGIVRQRLRGTTLTAPWWWAVVAVVTMMSIEVFLEVSDPYVRWNWSSHFRYAAGVACLGPPIAVFGAKRPQDRAWKFVVGSLLVVLLLPVAIAGVQQTGQRLSLDEPWRWFLLGLLCLGLVNYLPTRFGPAACCWTAATVLLLKDGLPFVADLSVKYAWHYSMAAMNLAILYTYGMLWRRRKGRTSIDRVWLDFRDAFGVVWALRVADRFNASSRQFGWGARLGWRGLVVDRSTSQSATEIEAAMEKSLYSLLRRFVSPAWIAERRAEF